jgi:molecular chaperone DnaK
MPSEPPETWGKWLFPQPSRGAAEGPETHDGAEPPPGPMSEQDIPRDSRRVPIARRISVKFDRFSGFIDEYVANVSPGGIFIRTLTPEAPGQELEFEFRLGDGFEIIRGRGEVTWNRTADEGPNRPAGMGIRFTELSPGSKDLIYRIVDDYAARGGIPFDLARDPSMPAHAPPPPVFGAAAPGPPAPPARTPGATGGGRGGSGSAGAPPAASAAVLPPPPRPSVPTAPVAPAAGAKAPARQSAEGMPAASAAVPKAPARPGVPAVPTAPAAASQAPAPPSVPVVPESLATVTEAPDRQSSPAVPAARSSASNAPKQPAVSAAASTGPAPAGRAPASAAAVGRAAETAPAAPPDPPSAVPVPPPARPAGAPGRTGGPPDASFADIAAELARIAPGPGSPLAAKEASPPAAAAPHIPNTGMTPEEQYALFSVLAPAGHPGGRDPLQEMAEALPPLDELTAEPPARPPPFSSVGRASERGARSRRGWWLAGGLLVLAAFAAAWLYRDALRAWTGRGEEPAAPAAAAPVQPTGARTGGLSPTGATATGGPAATGGAPAATSPAGTSPPVSSPATGAAAAPGGRAAAGAAAPAAPGQAAAGPTATAVEKITWEPVRGGLDVVLWGNGVFRPELVDQARLARPVREVLRIRGISQPFAATQLRVGTPELLQIRVGFHREGGSSQLHVVLDLGGPEVVVTGIEPRDQQLRVHVRAR